MLARLMPRSLRSSAHQLRPTAAVILTQHSARTFQTSSIPRFAEAATATSADATAAEDAAAAAAAVVAAARPPVSTRVFTKATLRRQALAQAQPWYMSSQQLKHLRRGGFDGPALTRLPPSLRMLKPEGEMKRLRHLEATKMAADPKRYICPFIPGDKIVVSKYQSLNDRTKFDRIAGLVIARFKGDRLTASFIIRSNKLGEDYELRFPLWSPFIARVDMVQPCGRDSLRQKLYYLTKADPLTWEVKVPGGLPKPTAEPQSIDHLAKASNGKIQILNFEPMKKQVLEKRAGGIGAEMAAAGGKAAPAKGKK